MAGKEYRIFKWLEKFLCVKNDSGELKKKNTDKWKRKKKNLVWVASYGRQTINKQEVHWITEFEVWLILMKHLEDRWL